MKIQFASDLHLEFIKNSDFLENNPLVTTGDILVLAGDIGYLDHSTYYFHPFWDIVSENYKRVLVIPGNHEFYGGYDLSGLKNGMELEIRKNVHCYYNKCVVIDDVEFILSPLWSFIPQLSEKIISRSLADFRCSFYNGDILTVAAYNKFHSECLSFLKDSFEKQKKGKRVVVTHHVPSFACVPLEFKGSALNSAFYSNQDKLIEASGADYWFFGHSHRNVGELKIGNTKVLSNQLGYVQHNEHKTFDNSMFVFL